MNRDSDNNFKSRKEQPRHLHLVEYRPNSDNQMPIDKTSLLNRLLSFSNTLEFNFIIIAREDIQSSKRSADNYKIKLLLNSKNKYKSQVIKKLLKEAIIGIHIEPVRVSNTEIKITSVRNQIDAISSITKFDMEFVHTGVDNSYFNIRYNVFVWCQQNAHLDFACEDVHRFIENNKYKLKKSCIIDTFITARNNYLRINSNINEEQLLNHDHTEIIDETVDGNFQEMFSGNVDFLNLMDPELLHWIENCGSN